MIYIHNVGRVSITFRGSALRCSVRCGHEPPHGKVQLPVSSTGPSIALSSHAKQQESKHEIDNSFILEALRTRDSHIQLDC
jgi:hypothetical protein